ncbi:MAG: GAF domain-containing protein [Gemmatimonadetes bacterium]|nr:GAF domain-containing protein [Gemmatimonadota bacterium]
MRLVSGRRDATPPAVRVTDGVVERDPAERRWIDPLPGMDGYWFEIANAPDPAAARAQLMPVLSQLLASEADTLRMADDLADRLEEIELLYSISEVLGRTIHLEEAARIIVREVSRVVGARRSSILVHDEQTDMLRPVAGWGTDIQQFRPVPVNDPKSIAARVFRDRHMVFYDPTGPGWGTPGRGLDPTYKGAAFLSVPILYPSPDGPPRPVGVINLTDREGADAFTSRERRLVSAIANQIGAAIENARLVERDRGQDRVRHELELAHDLQLSLLQRPQALGLGRSVAARCEPAESVGGDFYHVLRLRGDRVGVMLGDVSSHGFGAALVMALVLSAAGIHAMDADTPEDMLRRLLESVAPELARAEMHLTLFYGIVDARHGTLRYSNAGHAHAFRVSASGEARRLGATSPPLGLAAADTIGGAEVPWKCGSDLLVLVSDGITESRDEFGRPFGEEKVLDIVRKRLTAEPAAMVDAVFAGVHDYTERVADDRTLLLLRC